MTERSGPLIVSRGMIRCQNLSHLLFIKVVLAQGIHAPKGSLSRAVMEDHGVVA